MSVIDNDNGAEPSAILEVTAAEALARSEVTTAIDVAKRYPRSIKKFMDKAKSLATSSVDVAGSCFYRLKRTDKEGKVAFIEGPSARLAEIVASSWTNMRCAARVVHETGGFIVAQGIAHDLESNLSLCKEVRRPITTKNGRRFSDDMIAVTANAACSIALRNAICAVVPYAMVLDVMAAAKKVAIGDAKSLDERRSKMVAAFATMAISPAQILARLGKPSMADVDLADVEDLLGMFNAIKEGDAKIDEEFPAVASGREIQTVGGSNVKAPQSARVELNIALAELRTKDPEWAREIEKQFPDLHKATDAVVAKALEAIKPAAKAAP